MKRGCPSICLRAMPLVLATVAPALPAVAGTWVAHNSGLKNLTIIGIGITPGAPNTLYVQARSLGIYKSTDGGLTWTRKSSGIPDSDPGFGHLLHDGPVVHPSDPDTVWAVSNGYVYKTTNGGTSWVQSSSGTTVNGASAVRGVVLDPNNPAHLFAGTIVSGADGGVFESTNGGASWVNIAGSAVAGPGIGNDAWPIAVDATNAMRLYCGSPHESVYRSTDGGHTWIHTPPVSGDYSSYEVAVNPLAPSEVWTCEVGATWVSTDYGAAWVRRDDFNGDAIQTIAWAPSNAQVAYAIVGSVVWRSDNKGAAWTARAAVPGGPRCLAVHPTNPDVVFVGTSGLGMYRSTDGAASFVESNAGLPLTTLIHGSQAFAHPQLYNVMYCLLSGNVMYKSKTAGDSWSYYAVAPGSYVQTDCRHTNWWYCAAAPGPLYRSRDTGRTWQTCYSDGSDTDVFGFWCDPITSGRIWVGDRHGNRILRSDDGGDKLDVAGDDQPDAGRLHGALGSMRRPVRSQRGPHRRLPDLHEQPPARLRLAKRRRRADMDAHPRPDVLSALAGRRRRMARLEPGDEAGLRGLLQLPHRDRQPDVR